MPGRARIPKPTAQRLSLYLRELEQRHAEGRRTVSSRQLGQATGTTDAQVRKDLGTLAMSGQPGVGYGIASLIESIRSVIGVVHPWRAALVGAGNIGRALAAYRRFPEAGFEIAAVFDHAAGVVGTRISGIPVRPMRELKETVDREGIRIGIVAVPGEAAQGVADALVAAGVRGILNFAPRRLEVPAQVSTVEVDFRSALERLAFEMSERDASQGGAGAPDAAAPALRRGRRPRGDRA
ncbi:MAG: redox-sensing transcriptional repressor Rex [Phycisphaerales bacterium]